MTLPGSGQFPTMRSLLMVSPDSDRRLDDAAAAGADILMLDLVEAPPDGVRRALAFLERARRPPVFLRVSPLASGRTGAELDAAMPARPDGIALAAEGGADIVRLAALLRPREAHAGTEDGATRILAMATETPAAVFGLESYRRSSTRLVGLVADPARLATALGAEDTADIARTTRALTLLGAAAAGVAAIDGPTRGGTDEALAAEAIAARRQGYAGKLAVAIRQVAIINAAFSPAASSR